MGIPTDWSFVAREVLQELPSLLLVVLVPPRHLNALLLQCTLHLTYSSETHVAAVAVYCSNNQNKSKLFDKRHQEVNCLERHSEVTGEI